MTSAGLLVPGAAVFDLGRSLHVDSNLDVFDPDAQRRAVDELMREGPDVGGRIQVTSSSQFVAGDLVEITGGTDNDGKYYVVAAVNGSESELRIVKDCRSVTERLGYRRDA